MKAREEMKPSGESTMRGLMMLTVLGGLCLAFPRSAAASDAGSDAAAEPADAGALESAEDDAGGSLPCPPCPLACDGGLCDTTNGAETGGNCSLAPGGVPFGPAPIGAAIGVAGVVIARRARGKARRDARKMERE
jgi:hypothetical protein